MTDTSNQQNISPELASGEQPGVIEPIYVHLAITDPEVLAAVAEYPNGPLRAEFVSTCLKVGVLSLRAAKGVIDGDAIRNAGDVLINQLGERLNGYRNALEERVNSTLEHYFDPTSGLFHVRVENLVKADGDLARVVQGQVGAVQQELDKTLERFLGENSAFLSLLEPTESNRLLAAMRQSVDEVARAEKQAIVAQFSLDDPQSALSRLVRELTESHGNVADALKTQIGEVVAEFSLDNPDGALTRLVGRVEAAQRSISDQFSLDNAASALSRMKKSIQDQLDSLATAQNNFHREVVGLLSAMNARKEAEAKGTAHGATFEEAVGDALRSLAVPAGDIVEPCGTSTGVVRNSKVGDYVVVLPPESAAAGARIVIEAKESAAYTVKSTLDEADEARRNRSAGVCLFVHSAKTAPKGMEPLAKFGNDVLVAWDAEDPASDVIFRAGYIVAKALSVRAAQRSKQDTVSFQKIDKAVEAIRKQLGGFTELKTSTESIQSSSNRMLDRIRIMSSDLQRQVEILADEVGNLREVSSDGDNA